MRHSRLPGDDATLWALDLETTSADAARAEILAVGMVPVVGGVIHVGRAFASLVRPTDVAATDGIVAHHLRPADVADAPALADVLPGVLERLAGAWLLVHFAGLDVPVLRRASTAAGLRWPDPPVVDTARMVARIRTRQRLYTTGPRLPRGLVDARAALGLPPHDAHDALADAIATAELYLALRARR